jgi:RHS repeat-associated protein
LNKSDIGNYTYADNGYNNPHAVTNVNGTNYSYDNNGNLLSDGTWTHTWDYRNRLTESTNGATTIRYGYDQNDDRVYYSVNGTATTTYPNKYYNVKGNTITKQTYANNILVATIENGEIYFDHTDHLTGSNAITNMDGGVTQVLDYYPFGGIRLNERLGNIDEKRKAFGHEFDTETNLYYMVARYQNPAIGRFVSQDQMFQDIGINDKIFNDRYGKELMPDMTNILSIQKAVLSNPQSLNSYSYSINNPIIYTDPDGKDWELSISGTAWGFSGAAGIQFGWSGLNVFAAGGMGAGYGGFPISFSYTPEEISHSPESKVTIGGSAAYGIGVGVSRSGDNGADPFNLPNTSSQRSLEIGLGADAYVRKQVSMPLIGQEAPAGLELKQNPYSTPNYVPAQKKGTTIIKSAAPTTVIKSANTSSSASKPTVNSNNIKKKTNN